ncbi:MAG: hypothetical protein II776_02625 [Clostridia bacterium]|nr:hypothetical protein [Clostridia bacterium]
MADKENKVEEVTEEVKATVEKAEEKLNEVEDVAARKAEEAKEAVKAKAEEVKEAAKDKAEKVKTAGKKMSPAIIGAICGGVVAVVVVVLLIVAFVSGSGAISKYTAKDYEGAYNSAKMGWFMNKSDKDVITIGYVGNVLCPEGKYMEGAEVLKSVDAEAKAKDLEKLYKVNPYLGMCVEGAVVEFGTWEQDGDNSGEEPVEWVVLDVVKGDQPMALLLSTKVIGFTNVRSKTDGNTSYALSEIHGWCEVDFYKTFNANETVKGRILQVNVHTDPSSAGIDSGEDVNAHAFAPSLQDINTYLKGNPDLEKYIAAQGTATIKKQGAKVTNSGAAGYWLRNAGESEGFASAVTAKGEVVEGSGMSSSHGIRPMMWVSLG